MGERRDRNNRRWAQATSLIPIFGKHISQGIMQNSLSKSQAEQAAKINPIDPTYQESKYATEQLNLARNAQNARMPGSQQLESNAFRNQANTLLNLSRVGTSPQQMAAAAGAVQSNTNNALGQLALQEAGYKNQMLGNLNNALQGMTIEQNKVYNDQLRKYNRDFDQKQNLLNSSQQNFSNSLNSASGAMQAGVDTALQIFGLPTFAGKNIPTTGPAQTMSNFNAGSGSWFTLPTHTTHTPVISPYRG